MPKVLELPAELLYNSYASYLNGTLTTEYASTWCQKEETQMSEENICLNIPPDVETLTIKEMQSILRIGANLAYNLIHSKAFPVIRIGRSYRIPRLAFIEWVNQHYSCSLVH